MGKDEQGELSPKEKLERELSMLALVRRRLRESLGDGGQLSSDVVDRVLDEYNALPENNQAGRDSP